MSTLVKHEALYNVTSCVVVNPNVKIYPIFSHVFFNSSWFFVLIFIVSLTCTCRCGKKSPTFLTDFEDDEDIGISLNAREICARLEK